MDHFDGLVQDCSISNALAMEIIQFCTKPLTYKIQILLKKTSYLLVIWSNDAIGTAPWEIETFTYIVVIRIMTC